MRESMIIKDKGPKFDRTSLAYWSVGYFLTIQKFFQ